MDGLQELDTKLGSAESFQWKLFPKHIKHNSFGISRLASASCDTLQMCIVSPTGPT